MDKTKGRGRQKGARSIGRRMSQNRKIKEGKPKANILGYHNKKLLEIVNRNDHFQNCGSCTTDRLNSTRKKNSWISSGQRGIRFSTARPKSQSRNKIMKRPMTSRNTHFETMKSATIDHFQKNLSPFGEVNAEPNLEYLNTDVRSKGGETAETAWNRGYYLSTSIEGAQYNFNAFRTQNQKRAQPMSPTSKAMELESNPTGRERNINSYVNYELPKADQDMLERDSTWRQSQQLGEFKNGKANFGSQRKPEESVAPPQNESIGQVINPCPLHNNQEIEYLDKTEKRGLCKDCVKDAIESHHEILNVPDVKSDVNSLLVQLESNTSQMLAKKTEAMQVNRQKLQRIETDRKGFIAEQQRKINELHNYLDEKLRCIVAEYNKAVEPDVIKVKNNLDRCEEKAQEHKIFISEIQNMRQTFDKRAIPNFIDNVRKSANMLNYYNHLKTVNSTETHTMVYPTHKEDYHPVFDLDINKEVEILANKFRILSTPGVTSQQSYKREDYEEEYGNEEKKHGFPQAQPTQHNVGATPTQNAGAPLNQEKEALRTEERPQLFKSADPVFGPDGGQGEANFQTMDNKLVSVMSPIRKKLRIVRWLSTKMGEYDIENDFWNSVNAQIKKPFLPFSRTVYLPNQDMIVMGGLNDEIPNKPTFSSLVLKITEVPVNVYDSLYVTKQMNNMIIKRGCFTGLYQYGFVFAFGGLNYTHKVLRYCEKYDVENDQWEEIAPMVEPRKNASSCALTSDTIYVFGGSSCQSEVSDKGSNASDSIEQYCISTDTWTLLKIRLDSKISFQVSFKLSETRIILLGGSIKQNSKKSDTYKSNQVLVFDAMEPSIKKCNNLAKDVLSLYPPFYDDGNLYLVDEDESSENPLVVRYNISNLIR